MHSRVIPLSLSLPINQNLRFFVCGHHLGILFRILKKILSYVVNLLYTEKTALEGKILILQLQKMLFIISEFCQLQYWFL